jgi:hypothetical protein
MPKGKDQLTGGTKDVNPQYFYIPFTVPVAPAVGSLTISAPVSTPLPIPRFAEKGGRSIVMEILTVEFVYDLIPAAFTDLVGTGTAQLAYTVALTTNPNQPANSAALLLDPRTIQYDIWKNIALTDTAVGYTINNDTPVRDYNLTDQAGHGILVATDNVYIQQTYGTAGVAGTTGTGPGQGVCILTYRFKEVGLAEYVGIVQSQQ